MAVYFAGSEPVDFIGTVGAAIGATDRRTDYTRAALAFGSGQSVTGALSQAVGALWFSCQFKPNYLLSSSSTAYLVMFGNVTLNYWRVRRTLNQLIIESAPDGSTWTTHQTINDVFSTSTGLYRLTMQLTAAGEFKIWLNGILIGDVSGGHSGFSVDRFSMFPYVGAAPIVSEIIIADYDLRNAALKTLPVTGAGATSGWTGVFGNIDDTTISEGTAISAAAAGLVSTFATTTVPSDGLQVKAVAINSWAANDGSLNLQHVTRESSVDSVGPTQTLSPAYSHQKTIHHTNPRTGAAWTRTEVSGIEIGVKAVA
jgi:hypothetical protein